MYKKKEKLFENFVQKRGKKHKAEKIIKNALKALQKANKQKTVELIKKSIVLSSEGVGLIKQTIKKGKRKTVSKKTLLLISEKSQLSKAYLNITKYARTIEAKNYHQKISTAVKNINNNFNELKLTNTIQMIDRKASLKFRW